MKTKEELNALKNEISAINDKLAELSEDELKEVTGGSSACLPNQQRRKPDIKYMIGVCKICHQGYLQIVKDIETNQLYVYCDDCEAEWSNPEDAILCHNGSREKYGLISYPNYDEICNIGWEKYIK